jgi:LysR family hydrogen peroxide-inducible transcriptional activator
MITLAQMEYLIAVDKYGSFVEAAKNCFVTQPTLSMQIQKLEKEIGALIFDRSKQPVVTTEIGRQIIAQTRIVLLETSKIQEVVNSHSNIISGQLKIGIIPTVAPYLVPLFLEKFLEKYPKIEVSIDELQTRMIIDKLRKDEIDIAMLATPLNKNDLIEKPLYYEPFVGYVAPSHRLYKKKKITAKDLSLADMWVLNEGHCFRGQTLQICGDGEVIDNHMLHFGSGNLGMLKKLVDRNFGMTLIPYLSALEVKKTSKSDMLREFENPAPTREISLVYRREYFKKNMITALEKVILSCLPEDLKNQKNKTIVDKFVY